MIFSQDRVHQRFEEQNLEPPRFFFWKSDVGLVAPFTAEKEAFGLAHTFFYVKVFALFALENHDTSTSSSYGGTAAGWNGFLQHFTVFFGLRPFRRRVPALRGLFWSPQWPTVVGRRGLALHS